jgi:methyltransferase
VITAIVVAIVYMPMLIEARRAAANERLQRARGGVEPPDDVFKMMRVAYPGGFLLMIVDGALGHRPASTAIAGGLALYSASKALKWWAIHTLGPWWTFRVIVVPGAPLVTGGPYRFVRHPNYIAVVAELVAVAIMTGSRIGGPIAIMGFVLLILKRVAVEDRALTSGLQPRPPTSDC